MPLYCQCCLCCGWLPPSSFSLLCSLTLSLTLKLHGGLQSRLSKGDVLSELAKAINNGRIGPNTFMMELINQMARNMNKEDTRGSSQAIPGNSQPNAACLPAGWRFPKLVLQMASAMVKQGGAAMAARVLRFRDCL
jgi:hypothetical protein